MRFYDIFNGDADGLCGLQQLRLAAPLDAELVTGTKRDTALLARIDPVAGDTFTVLDISVDANAPALGRALAAGASVSWFDHHHSTTPPSSPNFRGHFDFAPGICTSLIVDRHLGGRHRAWAVVGAFGDNLTQSATAAAASLDLDTAAIAVLRNLGECLNYNAYGEHIDELMFHPAVLRRRMQPYADPLRFAAEDDSFLLLEQMRDQDLSRALSIAPVLDIPNATAVVLPDAAWSRRVGGTLANHLALADPEGLHAVLVPARDGFTVSLRASHRHASGAHAIARAFGGGGRAAAAGINAMPAAEIPRLLNLLREVG